MNPTILITRPIENAQFTQKLAKKYKVNSIIMPLINIKSTLTQVKINKIKLILDQTEVFFFNSIYSVEHFFNSFKITQPKNKLSFYCIGSKTQQKLQYYLNKSIKIYCANNSEELQIMVQSKIAKFNNKNILFISGKGGRRILTNFLQKELNAQHFHKAILYQRENIDYSNNHIIKNFNKCQIVLGTSNQIIESIFELSQKISLKEQQNILSKNLWVMSERNKIFAQKLGFKNTTVIDSVESQLTKIGTR